MHVADPAERLAQRLDVELRIAARPGEAAHVDERLDAGSAHRLDELLERPGPMTDGEGYSSSFSSSDT